MREPGPPPHVPRAAALAALLLSLASAPAQAQLVEKTAAEASFDRGLKLYKDAEQVSPRDRARAQELYSLAVEAFVSSFRLSGTSSKAFNIAATLTRLGRADDAYNWYETALAFELPPERRKVLVDARDTLQAHVALLEVTTDPAGAEIFLDRSDLPSVGLSPRRVALPARPPQSPGAAAAHTIIVRLAQHQDARKTVEVARGQLERVSFTLQRLPGRLQVKSTPAGATATADDRTLGTAPLTQELPPGSLQLRLSLAGHLDEQRTAEIRSGETTSLEVTLRRLPTLVASVTPAEARLTANGQPLPTRAAAVLPTGRVQLAVEAPGHEPARASIVLAPDEAVKLEASLARSRGLRPWQWPGAGYAGGALLMASGWLGVGGWAREARQDFYSNPTPGQRQQVRRLNLAADVTGAAGAALLLGTALWHVFSSAPQSRLEISAR